MFSSHLLLQTQASGSQCKVIFATPVQAGIARPGSAHSGHGVEP